MNQNEDRLKYLLELYAAKTATDEQLDEFFSRINSTGNAQIESLLTNMLETTQPQFDESRTQRLLQKILRSAKDNAAESQQAPVHKMYPWTRIAAAAIVFVLLSAGAYFYFKNGQSQKQIAKTETQQKFKNDVAPGGNKAILTLANGTQIILDSAANGTLTQQGNTKIIKLDNGQVAYREDGAGSSSLGEAGLPAGQAGVRLNTISTPRGGQYQIVLADGSKVWLNAASSLKFPAAFSGKERNVELTGEGYFEVAHNAAKPFTVSVNGMEVHDIGTAFNINAYSDEAVIKTTLLEGSVKITQASPSLKERDGVRLKPGEQASFSPLGAGGIMVKTADLDEAMAWKNGLFQFNHADLQTVMRQLSRWYDVDISYEGRIPEQQFGGKMGRDLNLTEVLLGLQKSDVHFRIEGRKLIVTP